MSLAFAAEEISAIGRPTYYWFRPGAKDGTLEHIRQVLVNRVREQSVRSAEASSRIIDTQTVKTAAYAHRDSGYDSAKKSRTQTQYRYRYPGLLLDGGHHLRFKHRKRFAGFLVLRRLHQCYDSVRTVWCDAGFKVTLIALALSLWQITLEVIPRPTKRFHTSETTVGC